MGCFTVNWEIKNFSVLLPDIGIRSANFKISEKSVWAFCYLRHDTTSMEIMIVPQNGILNYDSLEASFISPSGKILIRKETIFPLPNVVRIDSASPLHDDTLTVCCKMWKATTETRKICISTVLHRDDFSWTIVHFNPIVSLYSKYMEKCNLLFYMIMERNADQRTHTLQVGELPSIGGCLSLVYFKPSINVQHGSIITNLPCLEGNKWKIEIFSSRNPISNFQIQMEAIYAVHKEIHDRPVIGSSGTLNEDLLHLFREALHSDSVLNAEGKSFPVHKSILSTRSEVFRAMFEKEQMTEGREGVVAIEDLDSQTMSRLLVFLYGDLLGELNWEEASALYYAADKYAVLPLKKKCTEILKASLSMSNACDILDLADKHSDQALMKSTVDFILDHKEVISSSKWKKLEESNSRLTFKIMKEILLKKWVK